MRRLLAIALLAAVFTPVRARADEAPPPYPTHVGDSVGPHNHAHWPVRVRNLDQIKWTFSEGKHVGMAAPIGAGLLFVQAGGGGIRGVEAGTGKRWWVANGNPRYWNYSSCVLGPGGIAYGGNFGFLQAVNRKGKCLWQTNLQCSWIHRPPAVSPDGSTVYAAGDALGLVSLNAENGLVNWMRRDFKSPWNDYVFDERGRLILTARNKTTCFDKDGRELWSLDYPVAQKMVVGDLLIGTFKEAIVALGLDDRKARWTLRPGGSIVDLALTDQRRIVASMLNGELLCVTLDGRERWRSKLSDTALHRPVTALGGETLVADVAGRLYLCNSRGEVVSSIETGGQPYRWRPTVSRDGDVFLGHRDTIHCITGANRPARKPLVATELLIVADDFVVDLWVNGRTVPLTAREMLGERHGAMTESVHVDLQAGDWVVFNVVANRLRWKGSSYFGVYAFAPGGGSAFVSTTEGGWSACDDPAKVTEFIAGAESGADQRAVVPKRPWSGASQVWNSRLGRDFPGEPVWGQSANTWIKFVVPGRAASGRTAPAASRSRSARAS